MPASEPSRAFEALHPAMQRWVWRQGWATLRATQEQAIPTVLEGGCDVIIAAATAGGKTEAAFLPILSRLLAGGDDDSGMGLVLYISPLKALINDQYGRLDLMTDGLDLPVVPWHGDIPQKLKHGFLKNPRGMLLITPESLEAICVTHGHRLASLFERLEYIVVDELHAFIGTERGMQLQSLMHRLELAIRRRVARVGLSATLGDMQLAAGFLRLGGTQSVRTIVSTEDGGELKLQIRGYQEVPPALSPGQAEATEERGAEVTMEDTIQGDVLDISQHLFQVLRGTNNLVFANSRRTVETYADLLLRQCEQLRVPVEFFPHHGSLSKELREHVEIGLKAQTQPVTAVCTSTLEMGIDIGSVASIAQIGPPHQVASMRQRLGRSGRRGEAAILRIYIQEREIDQKTPAPDRLRPALFQSIAMTELLLARWTEPPLHGALHLSTLIQQILSVIAQHGGATAQGLWNALCENAPFAAVGHDNFVALLRRMGQTELLSQSADGTLLHGEIGERVVNHYSFFAAFATPEEFTLAVDGKVIGTLPIDHPVAEGDYLIFAGRRWRVLRLDVAHKRIDLARAGGGRAPSFGGTAGIVHDAVRAEMHDLYCGEEVPVYLDARAQKLLAEGRHHFRDLRLDRTAFLDAGEHVFVFPWAGDIALDTLAAMLTHSGIRTQREGVYLCARDTTTAKVQEALRCIAARDQPAPGELAAKVENKASEKYDEFLDDDLLSVDWASRRLNVNAALQLAQRLCASN